METFFVDPEEQFRFEVEVSWARRIPAAEKAARPLSDYVLGPEFLHTVERLGGVGRDKILDVVVEVLTRIVYEMPGRELHQLRQGEAGGSPPIVRDDGATCWRVSLQSHTPQARRLHYWQLPDGHIELSRVTQHDDFSP